MAWRIDEQLIRGELDCRERGRVRGTLWFLDREEPVVLDLEGCPWRDLAGRRIRITNPAPKPGGEHAIAAQQQGFVGDITASRRVKVPDVPMEEFIAGYKSGRTFTFHWANCLYLEWFSLRNRRVVIESTDYHLEIEGPPAWEMNEEDEREQLLANQRAMTGFMDRMLEADIASARGTPEERDPPKSAIEAEADAEDARMSLLLDRIAARIEREGFSAENYDRIMDEERERLRRERGEPEPEPLTPEQEAERDAWIKEMNAITAEAIEECRSRPKPERHPLVTACSDLGTRLFHEAKAQHWLADATSDEHPLLEVIHGVQFAGAKLAGALPDSDEADEWPPEPLFAGDVLVRLKKARGYLHDALAGLDAAEEHRLATPAWLAEARPHVSALLARVEALLAEVRGSLE